jgi:hypothetical protein
VTESDFGEGLQDQISSERHLKFESRQHRERLLIDLDGRAIDVGASEAVDPELHRQGELKGPAALRANRDAVAQGQSENIGSQPRKRVAAKPEIGSVNVIHVHAPVGHVRWLGEKIAPRQQEGKSLYDQGPP